MKDIVNLMEIGWHFTSLENWEKIQAAGLLPQKVECPPGLKPYFDKVPNAIWIWEKYPNADTQIGMVLFQVARHNTPKVVLLKVKYWDKDLLRYSDKIMGERRVAFPHTGTIQNFRYVSGTRALLLLKPALPAYISPIKEYNLRNLIR